MVLPSFIRIPVQNKRELELSFGQSTIMLRDIIEIALSYVQYLMLAIAIAPGAFPSFFRSPSDEVLKYINLDFQRSLFSETGRSNNFLNVDIPDSIPLDARLWFLVISVILPLLLNFVGIMALAGKRFILWYCFVAAGFLGLTAGLYCTVARDAWLQGWMGEFWGIFVACMGGAFIAVGAAAMGFAYWYMQRAARREALLAEREEAEAEAAMLQRRQGNGEKGGGHRFLANANGSSANPSPPEDNNGSEVQRLMPSSPAQAQHTQGIPTPQNEGRPAFAVQTAAFSQPVEGSTAAMGVPIGFRRNPSSSAIPNTETAASAEGGPTDERLGQGEGEASPQPVVGVPFRSKKGPPQVTLLPSAFEEAERGGGPSVSVASATQKVGGETARKGGGRRPAALAANVGLATAQQVPNDHPSPLRVSVAAIASALMQGGSSAYYSAGSSYHTSASPMNSSNNKKHKQRESVVATLAAAVDTGMLDRQLERQQRARDRLTIADDGASLYNSSSSSSLRSLSSSASSSSFSATSSTGGPPTRLSPASAAGGGAALSPLSANNNNDNNNNNSKQHNANGNITYYNSSSDAALSPRRRSQGRRSVSRAVYGGGMRGLVRAASVHSLVGVGGRNAFVAAALANHAAASVASSTSSSSSSSSPSSPSSAVSSPRPRPRAGSRGKSNSIGLHTNANGARIVDDGDNHNTSAYSSQSEGHASAPPTQRRRRRHGSSRGGEQSRPRSSSSTATTNSRRHNSNSRQRRKHHHHQQRKKKKEHLTRDTNQLHLSKAAAKASYDLIMRRRVAAIDAHDTATRAVYAVVFGFLGLFMTRSFTIPNTFENVSPLSREVIFGFGIVFFVVAAIAAVWLALGLTYKGRVLQFKIGVFARDNFVSILLLLISVLYIPSVTNVIVIFNCQSVTCPPGRRLRDARSSLLYSADSPFATCEPCAVTSAPEGQLCPAALASSLCSHSSYDTRLKTDAAVSCDEIQTYFWPAAGIVFVYFVVSVPLLNLLLTRLSTALISSEFPVDARQVEGYSAEEIYREKVDLSDNVAKFIYDPFQRRYKQWRLLLVLQKLAIVVVSVFSFGAASPHMRSEALGLLLSLVIHAAVLAVNTAARPYIRKVENIFAIATQLSLCAACAIGLANALSPTSAAMAGGGGGSGGVPVAVGQAIAVLAYVGPAMALAVGAMLTFRDEMALAERRDDTSRRMRHHIDAEYTTAAISGDGDGVGGGELAVPLPSAAEAARGRSGSVVAFDGAAHALLLMMRRSTASSAASRANSLISAPTGAAGNTTNTHVGGATGAKRALSMFEQAQPNAAEGSTPEVAKAKAAGEASHPLGVLGLGMGMRSVPLLALKDSRLAVEQPTLRPSAAVSGSFGPLDRFVAVWQRVASGGLRAVDTCNKEGAMTARALAAVGASGGPAGVGVGVGNPSFCVAHPPPLFFEVGAASPHRAWLCESTEAMLLAQLTSAAACGDELAHNSATDGGEGRISDDEEGAEEGGIYTRFMRPLEPFMSALSPSPSLPPRCGVWGWGRGGDGPLKSGAAGRKRHQMRLRARLKRAYERHLLALVSLQRGVDLAINANAINLLILFFVFCGVCSVVAFTASFLGVASSDEGAHYVGATRQQTDDSALYQLLNFSTWEAFTSHCCCLPMAGLEPSWPNNVVAGEKWVCNARNDQTAAFAARKRAAGPFFGGGANPLGPYATVEDWLAGGEADTLTPAVLTTKERFRVLYSMDNATEPGAAYSGLAIRPLCGMVFSNNCSLEVDPQTRRVRIVGCSAAVSPEALALY